MKDLIFVQFDEPFSERHLQLLNKQFSRIKVISGVRGISQAYRAACEAAQADYFYVIDGDNEVLSVFNEEWADRVESRPTIFWSTNDFGITYGHGAIKLLCKRQFVRQPERPFLDFPDFLFRGSFNVNETILSYHRLGAGFQRWRTIFRELAKLALRNNQVLVEWLKFDEPKRIYSQVCEFICTRDPYQIFEHLNDYSYLNEMYEQCLQDQCLEQLDI